MASEERLPVAIRETNFDFPGQIGDPYHGKVGDVYTIEHEASNLLVIVRTDRISAFDVVLPKPIPYKGQVLSEMSAELLAATRMSAPNWLLDAPDPNVTVGFKAKPFKVEMIMRAHLLGNSWRGYEAGMRDFCGNTLPDGMQEFQPFPDVILTPTTKADAGHDENITPAEIVEAGIASRDELAEMAGLSFDLFARGQDMANERGLVLADTKYEFGRLPTGQIVVIDEVHTPDSSRYFPNDEIEAYLGGQTDRRPKQLSKEFVREWLLAQGFRGDPGQDPPNTPRSFIDAVSDRYIGLYQCMLGHTFNPARAESVQDRLDAMRESVVQCLGSLSLV
jgi:phosphoribosylaminoimidazole-succinocarboxamide synthase